MNQTQAIQLVRDTFESAFAKAGFIKFIKNLLTQYEEAEITLSPRGFRVLHELHRLPASIAERVVDAFGKLSRICESTEEDLTQIKGIGMVRARTIRTGITHMKTMYNSFPQELRHGRKRIYRSLA